MNEMPVQINRAPRTLTFSVPRHQTSRHDSHSIALTRALTLAPPCRCSTFLCIRTLISQIAHNMRLTSSSSAFLAALAFMTSGCASAAPSAADLKDNQPRGPVLPLRPISQVPFNAPSFIVGGELADSNESKWTVALVTNTHVSHKPSAQIIASPAFPPFL